MILHPGRSDSVESRNAVKKELERLVWSGSRGCWNSSHSMKVGASFLAERSFYHPFPLSTIPSKNTAMRNTQAE